MTDYIVNPESLVLLSGILTGDVVGPMVRVRVGASDVIALPRSWVVEVPPEPAWGAAVLTGGAFEGFGLFYKMPGEEDWHSSEGGRWTWSQFFANRWNVKVVYGPGTGFGRPA